MIKYIILMLTIGACSCGAPKYIKVPRDVKNFTINPTGDMHGIRYIYEPPVR